MKSDEERISFVLRFMQTDLNGLREGDWLNLREDVMTFLGWSPRWREQITLEGVGSIKEEVSNVLGGTARTFAPHAPGGWEAQLPRMLLYGGVQKEDVFRLIDRGRKGFALGVERVRFLFFDVSEPGKTRVLVGTSLEEDGSLSTAALQDAFLFSLLTTLSRLDITYLRRCPVCSRFFYAEHGRQIFCTPQCASRAGTKRFRAKHKEKENERGRRNYETKVKKKLGSNVQVGKRVNAQQGRKEQ